MAVRRGILDRTYIFEYDVGQWSFGTIQVLRERDSGQLRTCKTVPKSQLRNVGNATQILTKLKDLQHPHLAHIIDVLEDQSSYYVLTENQPGGDVADWLSRLDETNWLEEQTCANYIRQVTLALVHCHAANVWHRDLRPSNLLLTSKLPDATVKVVDFGLAAIFDADNAIVQRRPSAYIAPEVLLSSDPIRGGAADVWSIGAIAHALLVGHAPTESSEGLNSGWNLAAHVRNGPSDEVWCERSSMARDFVVRLLRPEGERPTAAKALQHPWLKGLLPIGGVHLRADNDIAREARHKTLCYTVSVFLVPVLVPYRDFEQLNIAFQQSDSDRDGFISKAVAQRLLMGRCAQHEAVSAALSIADVGKEDVIDLCGAACADLIAREFFASGPTGAPIVGQLRATDLAPRMLKRFLDVFGEKNSPACNVNAIRTKMRTQTARDLEMLAGVRYDEILSCLPEDQLIDTQVLAAQLSMNAGRGTPLVGGNLTPLKDKHPWSSPLGLDFGGFLSSCGMGAKRELSPHSMRLF